MKQSEQNTPVKLSTPLSAADILPLKAGDAVLLSGTIYTARDAAHQRLTTMLEQGLDLPFPAEGAVLYYCGPTPPPPGHAIGSAGPTSSYRMDTFAPGLHEKGVKATIGKGPRGPEILLSLQKNTGVYLGATGGAGALLGSRIKAARLLAFPDLGPEAIYELEVEDFPLLVIYDARGGDIFRKADYLMYPELA